ncbi:hypothetical protein ACIBVL_30690 [Streptomyces sp. NPDC049687]|uniref:hypothetical protein n=1 Tax=Streptomyces sp. NPDC049687 TaxID=3365596 RepID=UPI0037A84F40
MSSLSSGFTTPSARAGHGQFTGRGLGGALPEAVTQDARDLDGPQAVPGDCEETLAGGCRIGAHQAITEQSYGPVIAAITELLDAGKKDGSIRPDADRGISSSSPAPCGAPRPAGEDRAPHMLALILDGLRTHR